MARADRTSVAQVGEEFGVGRLGQLDRFEVVGMLDVDTYRTGGERLDLDLVVGRELLDTRHLLDLQLLRLQWLGSGWVRILR